MRIKYEGRRIEVIESSEMANRILADDAFYENISAHDDFDYTSHSPAEIARWIQNSSVIVIAKLYKGEWGSRTTAYVSSKYPDTVFLNSRKLDRPRGNIANTLVHEYVHSVDGAVTDARFGHGNNSSVGKKNSAPYWIGNLAEGMMRGAQKGVEVEIEPVIIEEIDIDESLIED